jgi:isonocardicin synthase
MLDLGCQVLFCSYIKAEMILGKLLRVQTSEVGIDIYYEDIAPQSRLALFEQLMNDKMIDIYFPYVPLKKDDHTEYTSSAAGWKINPKLSSFLLNGERSQREISIDLIKSDGKFSPVIYDPACSTGDFLYSIKTAIPDAIVIGQDLSQDMCAQARQKIDQVTHGDALFPCLPMESCDYIFFRFLNIHVISCSEAKALFEAIIPCLKKEGKAVLFGFTPVLISLPYIIKKGFRVLSCNAPIKSENAIIQYYIIQKI